MKTKFVQVLLAAFFLAGCGSQLAHLYPVQGPVSAQSPLPVSTVIVTGLNKSGTFKITLAGGEICTGQWTRIVSVPAVQSAGAASTDGTAAMWDTVFGPGFYVAHVLGATFYGRGTASGNQGTTMIVEYYHPPAGSGRISALEKGIAKDNHGNIYKMVFE